MGFTTMFYFYSYTTVRNRVTNHFKLMHLRGCALILSRHLGSSSVKQILFESSFQNAPMEKVPSFVLLHASEYLHL